MVSNKFIRTLMIHTITLLLSVIVISIVNYEIDGGWTSVIVMMCVLVPQFLFVIGLVIYKLTSKTIIYNKFLLLLIAFEGVGMALVGMESINNVLPMIGFSILYVAIAISWVILTYYNGTWGKFKDKKKVSKKVK